MSAQHVDWQGYLATFHGDRPGITEDVLQHALDPAGRTPYGWAAEAVPPGGRVLDLACGSAPMAAHLTTDHYLGLDVSPAELQRARGRGLPVAVASSARLPLPDASIDAVVVSMALMLVPLLPTLVEVGRVLRPGGVLVATVPYPRPMPRRDWLRYARLCVALRHPGLHYPNDEALRAPAAALVSAGLELRADAAQAFTCALPTTTVAEQLLDSLYLPDVDPRRMAAGRQVVHGWAGSTMTTPVRRLVAVRR